jgi:hypothetical protein
MQMQLCDIPSCRDGLFDKGYTPSTYGDFLFTRNELVQSHSSLPAIVEGIQTISATDWVQAPMKPLIIWLIGAGVAAAVISTIACSNGVFLVAIAGAVQALGAWALMLHVDQLQTVENAALGPANVWMRLLHWQDGWIVRFIGWVLLLLFRPLWLGWQCLTALWVPNWVADVWSRNILYISQPRNWPNPPWHQGQKSTIVAGPVTWSRGWTGLELGGSYALLLVQHTLQVCWCMGEVCFWLCVASCAGLDSKPSEGVSGGCCCALLWCLPPSRFLCCHVSHAGRTLSHSAIQVASCQNAYGGGLPLYSTNGAHLQQNEQLQLWLQLSLLRLLQSR